MDLASEEKTETSDADLSNSAFHVGLSKFTSHAGLSNSTSHADLSNSVPCFKRGSEQLHVLAEMSASTTSNTSCVQRETDILF